MSSQRWKILSLVLVLTAAVYYLLPNYQFYFEHTKEERESTTPTPEVAELRGKVMNLGLDLLGGMHVVLEVDVPETADPSDDTVDRVLEILRNRVDEFGVAEPVIQKQGDNRIVLDLASVKNPEQVRNLIGKTARLEFRMCKSKADASQIVDRVDAYIASVRGDTTGSRPLWSQLSTFYQPEYGFPTGAFFRADAKGAIEDMLATAGVDSVLGPSADMLFGEEEERVGEQKGYILYFLDRAFQLTGDQLKTAERAFDIDFENPGAAGVRMVFTNRGATRFAQVTKANVGNHLAIVLDDKVRSAPVIRERISGGTASITGSFTDDEALMLATVLRAGALPADVHIIEERTVGPSLGKDSIDQGLRAGLIGAAVIVAFIVIWYKLSGMIAVVALALNVILIFSGLSMMRGTLTLPGIAGIVLTIGMAVDANVLIFERIREELRNGKTARAAIDSGYARALTTIIDSNLTTLIAALVLFQYGTGPIRGFAVTLSIGIVANVFTAVLVTRLIFDAIYRRAGAKTVSI